jgi:hypothetical protein
MQMLMEKFVNLIVQKLKDANLFASQGGPIILAQVHWPVLTIVAAASAVLSVWHNE